jgi:hypothetical protein
MLIVFLDFDGVGLIKERADRALKHLKGVTW